MCTNTEPTVCILNNNIKKAVDVSQRAHRNYDLSKTIPENDLHTLIYAAKNSPAKQNETHYALEVYTDPELIHQVYNETKKFTLGLDKKPVLLVGVGYDQLGTDRRLHAETLNKDIPITSRNGELDEKWRFPSFEKHTSVKINGKEIKNTGNLN